MVVRMRVNRSKSGKRRSHHALVGASTVKCASCGALRLNHRACVACSKYNGRTTRDVVLEAKKTAQRNKRREKALRESGQIKSTDKSKESTS